jgi:hypothetical protein
MISTGRIYKKSFSTIDTDRFFNYRYSRISIAALTNQLRGNFKKILEKIPENEIENLAAFLNIDEKLILLFLNNNWKDLQNRGKEEIIDDIKAPLKTFLEKTNDKMNLRHLTLKKLNEYKEGIKTEVASGEKGLRVIEITDPDTCVKLTKDSGWCVQKHEFAEEYLEKGPLYLIVKDGKRFALISFATSSFMDVYDNPLKAETIRYIFNNSDLGKYAPKGGVYDYITGDNARIDFKYNDARIDFKNNVVVLSKGKNEKEYKCWHNNGQMSLHCHLKNNKLNGEYKEWYDNGQILTRIHYKNGKKEGEFKKWYRNGQLQVHCFYKNDERDGDYREWNEDGELVVHLFYENGVIKERFLEKRFVI